MAWDSPRRGVDPLARAWGRQFIGVDELDFYKSANLSISRDDDEKANMGKLLSPIDEEGYGMSYNKNAPLAVHLTVRFNDPAIRSVHTQSFYSSRSFRASDRICRGLVRRIDHCCEELITRKDSDALHNIQCLRKGPKPWRFEMTFKVAVKGHSGAWAERIFISYQKQPLTRTSAEQVLRSAQSIAGLFLQRHDKNFHWRDGQSGSYFPDSPETFRPSPDGPPNLACIPRTLFIETSQNWEFVPGYTLKLVLKSNNPARGQPSITRTIRIDSSQISPLNLDLGEDLLWHAYRCVQDVLDVKKNSFDELHADCDELDDQCQHYEKDALSLELTVANNLGPVYDHLRRSIQSDICLFGHPEGYDCDEFVDKVRQEFKSLRSKSDQKTEKLHDFDFRIAELIGDGWRQENCARFIVNEKQTLTRRTIEALLDRIRSGVGDVLKEHDVAVRMIAYKRGHLVLDKALVARERHLGSSDPPNVLIDRLQKRIQKDIDMICKDTCSLDDIPEVAPSFTHTRPQIASSRPYTARPTSSPQTPPGSPASFRTRPPTPPGVPLRKSSSRVFPLVPIKYKDTGDSTSVGSRSPVAPAIREESREDESFPGLKPAAEVYRAVEFDAESNSTHSSMPTLAESDTPSPEHSMLITPNFVRSYMPTHGGLPFEGSGLHRFSTDQTSVSSRTSYSEAHHQCAEAKDEKSGFRDATNLPSDPVNTPKTFKETQMQDTKDISGSTHDSGTNTIACPPTNSDEMASAGSERESSVHDLPTEGWLLYACESDHDDSETPMESHSPSCNTTVATENDSAKMPPLPEKTNADDEAPIGEAKETDILKHDSENVHIALSCSAPAEVSESDEWTASDADGGRDLTTDEALSRSKPDFFEEDDEEAVNSGTIEICTPIGPWVPSESAQCPVGVSEGSEQVDHVTSVSETDADSEASEAELDQKQLKAATDLVESLQAGQNAESSSVPYDTRDDASDSPIVTEETLPAIVESSKVKDFKPLASPVPTSTSETIPSVPTEQPGENKYLLPEINSENRNSWSSSSEWEDWISEARQSSDSVDTIKASLHRSVSEDDHESPIHPPERLRTPTAGLLGLSESRWADFGIRSALTGTHAFDNFRPSTAPMLAAESSSSEKSRREDFELRDEEHARPASPRKPVASHHHHHHLRQKKSIGSILFRGAGPNKSNKLNKKQSRDLKKNSKAKAEKSAAPVEPNVAYKESVEGTGRFPRAMMLVAGLALASSVVSRNSA